MPASADFARCRKSVQSLNKRLATGPVFQITRPAIFFRGLNGEIVIHSTHMRFDGNPSVVGVLKQLLLKPQNFRVTLAKKTTDGRCAALHFHFDDILDIVVHRQ